MPQKELKYCCLNAINIDIEEFALWAWGSFVSCSGNKKFPVLSSGKNIFLFGKLMLLFDQ